MRKKKTFILGVGAQKAGTTWLYEYIQNSPNANFGQLKEYHFWNSILSAKQGKTTKKNKKLLSKPISELSSCELLRMTMLINKSYYELYFNSIINSGFSITGDITPQYARIISKGLHTIKGRLENYGFSVKVIYLIRDPIERLWSNIRMEKNLYSSIGKEVSDSEAMKLHYKRDRWRFDSEYDKVIINLRDSFKEENIYIGVYEEMFTKDKVKELSDFVGIEYNFSMLEKKINSSRKSEELDLDVIKEVRKFYNETYEFCFKNFPQTIYLWKK